MNLLALTEKLQLAETRLLFLLELGLQPGEEDDGSIFSPRLGVRSELKTKKIIYKNLFIVDVFKLHGHF